MSAFDGYVFFLCLFVFVSLTALFSVMLHVLLKQGHKAIEHGLEDERIKNEYIKETERKKLPDIIFNVLSVVVFTVIMIFFAVAVGINVSGDTVKGDVPHAKIVLSDSMAKKRESNTYLLQNNLNDQFNMFDVVLVHQLPDEFELELYDIVVYQYEDTMVIHRIIGIQEPNEDHPEHRHFVLRGDNAKYSDEIPVLYSQMRAIYKGERIPFIGSFFAFLQSPAGYLCILLILFAVFATPIAEKKLWNAKLERLRKIGFIKEAEEDQRK